MIIFINGSINAGKSTIAKLLSKKLKRPAILEIDDFNSCINWMDIDKAVPINLENAVAVIKNFSKRNFNIVVPYPLSESDYRYMIKNLKNLKEKIYIFTLNPKKEKIKKSTKSRKLGKWERNRIDHHYKIGIATPSFGKIIDNTNQTTQETANIILRQIL